MSEETKNATATEATAEAVPETEAPVIKDDVRAKLAEYGVDAETTEKIITELGVEKLEYLAMLTEQDLREVGMKPIQARRLLLKATSAPKVTVAPEKVAASTMAFAPDINAVLPEVPDGGSWLNSMRLGGVLKVGRETYMSAIQAALATRCGLYGIPDKLTAAMSEFAEKNEEPVTEMYFKLMDQITRRDYSELFSTTKGLTGAFATKKRREEFMKRVDAELWPAIYEGFVQLNAWYDSMLATQSNPALLYTTIAGLATGGNIGGLGFNVPPTDNVRDAADTLKDKINHVFRGTAAPIAAALAYDAMEIVKVLENPDLPAMIGAVNRDQMLRNLGVNVTPNYARQEQNLVRFTISFVEIEERTTAGSELQYLNALWQLGRQIEWGALVGKGNGLTGITSLTGSRVL